MFKYLILCVALILCISEGLLAQSGRRTKSSTTVTPTASSTPVSQVESAPRMSAMIIGGQNVDPETKEVWSNTTSTVAKACTDRLKERPLGLELVYGGKMTKTEATERAKKETTTYVLWFGYRFRLDGLESILHYIDYLVFLPQTGKVLTEGRVYPAQQKTAADPGGIHRLPRRSRNPNSHRLEEAAGREIADRIRGKL